MVKWNPLKWGRKSVHPSEYKTLPLGANDSLGRLLMFGHSGHSTPAEALRLYDKSTAVSIPINMVSEGFASLTPILEGPDGKIEEDHPVLDLLRTPSPFFDGDLFADTIAKNYLITGDTEIIALGSVERPPLEIQPIGPSNISVTKGAGGVASTIAVSGDTLAGSYVLNIKRGRARYFGGALRELKMIRNYSTRDNAMLRGQSPLVSAAAEARQHILGNVHNMSLLERGGRMSLVFNFEEDMEAEDFEAARQKVHEEYGGAGNAGKIVVTGGGKLSVDEMGNTNKDMDFAKLQRSAQDSVALQYRVPLILMSVAAATMNNYKEAKLALYDDAILPVADRIFGGLSAFLLPRYNIDPTRFKITYNMDDITALALRRNEELKLRKGLAIETTNELRSMIGREPVDGGDFVLGPANLIPIGTDVFTDDNDPRIIRDD